MTTRQRPALGYDSERSSPAARGAAPRRGPSVTPLSADVCVSAPAPGVRLCGGAGRGRRRGDRPRTGSRARSRPLHRPPARDARPSLPRRRPDGNARQPADRAAAGPRPGRHDAGQLGDVLPDPGEGLEPLARGIRARARRELDGPVLRARRGGAVGRRGDPGAGRPQRRDRPPGGRGARLVAWLSAAQRDGLRRFRRVRVRLPDLGQAAHRDHLYPAGSRGRRRDPRRRRRPPCPHGRTARPRVSSRRRHADQREAPRVSSPPGRSTPRCCSPAAVSVAVRPARTQSLAASATAVVARMDEIVDMAHGVPQSFYVDEFAADGIMFEGLRAARVRRDVAPADRRPPRRRDGRLPPSGPVRPDGLRQLTRARPHPRRPPGDPL